jgi:hypothetical protein
MVVVIILGLAAVGIVGSLIVSEGGLRNILSRNWSVVDGTIDGGDVVPVQGRSGTMFRATVEYSYQIAGQVYTGTLSEDFLEEGAASDFVESRKGVAAQVKYSPRHPRFSILL